MPRQTIHAAPGGPSHGQGMVAGVRAGGFLYFSAIRGYGAGGPSSISPDTEEQTRQAFRNLELLLEGAGATLDDVVHVTLYLHDLKYRKAFHEVWMEYFPVNPPARIAVQVANANSNVRGNAHFALDVIALAP